MKTIVKILAAIFLVFCIYFLIKDNIKGQSWDLMICKTLTSNGIECEDTSYVLKGYKTQNECMEKGLELAKNEGFECGKNCIYNDSVEADVCGIICNKSGCKD